MARAALASAAIALRSRRAPGRSHLDVDGEAAASVASEAGGANSEILVRKTDVTDFQRGRGAGRDRTVKEWGGLDVMVNNAD